MPIKRQPVKVLRFWYRISLLPEVQGLSALARWWLYGVVTQWTGHNNGVIEFCRRRHATAYGLGDSRVFGRARRDVLATGLVQMTREGGRNLRAMYFLTLTAQQASPPILGRRQHPTGENIVGCPQHPMDEKTGCPQHPNRVTTTPKEFANFPRKTHPSLIRKEKSAKPNLTATEIAVDAWSNSEAHQGEGSLQASIAPQGPTYGAIAPSTHLTPSECLEVVKKHRAVH